VSLTESAPPLIACDDQIAPSHLVAHSPPAIGSVRLAGEPVASTT
jgi:hypothetical protein